MGISTNSRKVGQVERGVLYNPPITHWVSIVCIKRHLENSKQKALFPKGFCLLKNIYAIKQSNNHQALHHFLISMDMNKLLVFLNLYSNNTQVGMLFAQRS